MTNKTKIVIYDDSCPFCGAYTNAFVKTGLIAKHHRMAFSNIDQKTLALIDTKRCVNEIPVIDTRTNEVWYGIDGLLEILHQKIPFIKAVANIKPIKWVLLKLYKLISFNRKMIIAPKIKQVNFDCTPDFNTKYRLFFLLLFLAFNTLMLFPIYENTLVNSAVRLTSAIQLQLAHFALISINICIAILLKNEKGIKYLGQANMLAIITILLNIPLLLLNKYFISNPAINNIYLLLTTVFIVKEYIRRMRFLEIFKNHKWITYINIISIAAFFTYIII